MENKQIIPMLKRWTKIILGKSAAAVQQGIGRCYDKNEIRGYYNDLTNKVRSATLLDSNGIPYNLMSSGAKVYSLVTISQYALGCYDLFLLNSDHDKLQIFLKLAEYLYDKQEVNGKWDARSSMGSYRDNSSCMAQGQGASIMLRAYLKTGNQKFLDSAKRAIDFMVTPVMNGGTMIEKGEDISFEKYPPENGEVSSVLNGWAFALFGLYDYYITTKNVDIKEIFDKSCKTMATKINKYDFGYCSLYDLVGTIASPAYHDLDIALLSVLSDLSGQENMKYYANRFESYAKNPIYKGMAITKKAVQKFTTKSDTFIVQ